MPPEIDAGENNKEVKEMSLDISSVVSATASTAYSAATKTSSQTSVTETAEAEVGATYEKSSDSSSTKATYTINKMSEEDRTALVNQLKADQEARVSQLQSLVNEMLGKQATTYANANDIWSILSSGDFTVDAATKAQAQADIAEDGYWGVAQTSQRMFDFAAALAGDDVDKMKEMQEAMMKGFEQATATWGKDLPEISQQTIEAANKLFEDYYASKGVEA